MSLVVFILLLWLIVIQVKLNRVQEQIDNLKNADSNPKISPTPDTGDQSATQLHTAATQTAEPKPHIESQEPAKEPAPQLIQAEQTHTDTLPKTSKPPMEITAAKLFSWIGGFMLFLGVLFGIKYAVENGLLSPALRIVLSTLTGLALVLAGYFIKNVKYRVTAHTLLGSGLAIVYAAIFCAHTFYDFIGLTTAFILMAITSFAALAVSLKKDAKYVGFLGAIIAFLTPILLNNPTNAWVAFFLYVFCINAVAAYTAMKKNWNSLLICTLSFTWLSQAAWLFPMTNDKMLGVAIFFSLYAIAIAWLARSYHTPPVISHTIGYFLTLGLTLMVPAAAYLSGSTELSTPSDILISLELLGYVVLANGLVLLLAGKNDIPYFFARIVKTISFIVLSTWMFKLSENLPIWMTLGACILFSALNGGVELFISRGNKKPDIFSALYPVATMGGLLIISCLIETAITFDFISMFGILGLLLAAALFLAVLAGMIWIAFIGIILLFIFLFIGLVTGITGQDSSVLVLLCGFVPLFLCGGVFFALQHYRKRADSLGEKSVSAVTALSPFILILTALIQAGTNLSVNWILGATFAVCALTALAARLYKNTFTLPIAAAGAGLIQLILWVILDWKNIHIPINTLSIWIASFLALFIAIPFLSKEHFENKISPWIASAITGLTACTMGCLLLSYCSNRNILGLIPAILFIIYSLLLWKMWGKSRTPQAHPVIIGFLSAVVLIFLTLIFPLQIHDHWLCVAWAAEAVFLAYLYTKLPHLTWKIGTAGLLCVISSWLLFAIDFSPLPTQRIWNWYLWLYGISAFALFASAALWDKPKGWKNAFYTMGGCILFWLLNIEIAHWFNTDSHLSFDFTGQLAQALTYTLAWGLFGLGAIGLGLCLQTKALSKAGVGVMLLTLTKFFLSDIWQLEALYRILGLFGLATLLIVASLWYQKKQRVQ